MAQDDDIKFVKENSIASNPITKKDLEKPELVIGFMKNEKGSDYDPSQKEGNVLTIKKRGDVYDFYRGDELRPSSAGIDADEVLRVLNNRTAGYTYLATSRKDPKLARWRDIDDEDIYTNRLRSDADPTRPLEFIGEETADVAEEAVDYKTKINNRTITVGEAFDAVLDKKLKPANRETISSLKGLLEGEGIDLNAPYFDVYETREFAEALDYSTNITGTHRYKGFGAFETQFGGLFTSLTKQPYIRLSDSAKEKGIATTRYGLTGTQIRDQDPMTALIPSDEVDKVYQKALSKPSYEKYTRAGNKTVVEIDADTRDYLIYEKYTGQRLGSNIGEGGLKVSDVAFYTDENGNKVATIVGKTVGGKTRPETSYTGPFADFLEGVVRRKEAELLPGADRNQADLFNTTESKLTGVWNALIRPELESKYSKFLPAGKQGSHSVIRKILARQLVQEFRFDRDAVKAWMGHAGAGVSASGDILEENYTGAVPDERISGMTDTLVRNDAFNNSSTDVNTMFIQRGVVDFRGVNVTYSTPESKITYTKDLNLLAPPQHQPETEGERNLRSALAEEKSVEVLTSAEEKRQKLEKIKAENAQKAAKTRRENEEARRRLGMNVPSPEDAAAQGFDGLSQETLDRMRELDIQVEGLTDDVITEVKPEDTVIRPAVKKGIKAGLTAAGTVVSKGAKSAVPGLFFEQRRQELMDRGDSPEIATVKAGAEELITPFGMSAAVVEGVGEPTAEEIKKQIPEEGFLSGITRAFTGQGMTPNFQSGGFVNKYRR